MQMADSMRVADPKTSGVTVQRTDWPWEADRDKHSVPPIASESKPGLRPGTSVHPNRISDLHKARVASIARELATLRETVQPSDSESTIDDQRPTESRNPAESGSAWLAIANETGNPSVAKTPDAGKCNNERLKPPERDRVFNEADSEKDSDRKSTTEHKIVADAPNSDSDRRPPVARNPAEIENEADRGKGADGGRVGLSQTTFPKFGHDSRFTWQIANDSVCPMKTSDIEQ
jgi:hypothetical protein